MFVSRQLDWHVTNPVVRPVISTMPEPDTGSTISPMLIVPLSVESGLEPITSNADVEIDVSLSPTQLPQLKEQPPLPHSITPDTRSTTMPKLSSLCPAVVTARTAILRFEPSCANCMPYSLPRSMSPGAAFRLAHTFSVCVRSTQPAHERVCALIPTCA